MNQYLSSIWLFAFNYTTQGFAQCNGQLASIAQNSALYALIGTTYGGDGVTTFAYPDLRGRQIVGVGQGPGLSNITLGQSAGSSSVTITAANMAAHTHSATGAVSILVNAPRTGGGNTNNPSGNYLSTESGTVKAYNSASASGNVMAAIANPTGSTFTGSSPIIPIMNPYLTLNYCIAIEGIFPSRN